jgi:hypothetical protein
MADADSSFAYSYPEWQPEYRAALLELDSEKLPKLVVAAETAIFKRLQAIAQSSDHQPERQAIEDALATLRVLKRNNLGFPDWGKK